MQCLCILVRRKDESLDALRLRLDAAIVEACENDSCCHTFTGDDAANYFRSRSAIRAFISPISRRCASMMPSASFLTRGSLMRARSLVRIAIEW